MDLLAGLLLVEPAHAEDGWLLLQRIAAGAEIKQPLSDFQADAARLTPEQMDTFTTSLSREGLRDALLLDAMILCLAIQGGKAAMEYIGGLAELLNDPAEHLTKLSALAAAVVQKDEDKLRGLLEKIGDLEFPPLLGWVSHVLQQPFMFKPNERCIWIEGLKGVPVPQEFYQQIRGALASVQGMRAREVTMRNAYFSGYRLDMQLFSGGDKLTLEGCDFQDIRVSGNNCVKFSFFSIIEIKNCRFENLSASDYTIKVEKAKKLLICDTVIQQIRGTVFNSYAIDIDAENCEFRNVKMEGITGKYWYYGCGDSTAQSCTYRDCQGETQRLPDGFKKV